ncbi:DPP IV N-terminal domain-containing protein [Kitasatospora gansuensis]
MTDRAEPLSPADGAVWGVAEFAAAEELGRTRGHWWSPDGRALLAARIDESALPLRYFADPARPELAAESFAYPQAGGPNVDLQLWVLGLDGSRVRLAWDTAAFPYVCAAGWEGDGELLLTVADRLQQTVLLLSADPATGRTRELSRTVDEFWVDDLPGTPARLDDGRLLTAADTPGGDARGVALDGKILTDERTQVRRVVGRLRGRLLIEAGQDDPADQHVFLLDPDSGALTRLSEGPGVHSAVAAARPCCSPRPLRPASSADCTSRAPSSPCRTTRPRSPTRSLRSSPGSPNWACRPPWSTRAATSRAVSSRCSWTSTAAPATRPSPTSRAAGRPASGGPTRASPWSPPTTGAPRSSRRPSAGRSSAGSPPSRWTTRSPPCTRWPTPTPTST